MDSAQSVLLMQIIAGLSTGLLSWGMLWLILRALCSRVVAVWLTNGLILTAMIAVLIIRLGFTLKLYDQLDFRGVSVAALMGLNLVVVPLFYWLDKRKARLQAAIRIPEAVLHCLSFSGGAASALICQKRFHHKTSKQGFRRTTWGALILNAALFYGFLYGLPFIKIPVW
ncbi:MAG: DUF1294 domain-containing protein [Oceanospirillales bacterium]|nr:DUF1294 domain-containing protein [Oceanospirillales bacterium]MBR9887859.1 DUF1294 domain-containing protein [Oceanospirillales bacterium]